MGELANLCKSQGSVKVQDESGVEVVWVYDWANEIARRKDKMTEEEIEASNRAYQRLQSGMK